MDGPAQQLDTSNDTGQDKGLFLTGLAINLGNPEAIVFFLALLPSVVDLSRLTPLAFAELATVVVAMVCGVFGAYTIPAIRARRLFTSVRAVRLVNRGSGITVAGAAAAIATR
ncbi:MAG: LysE family transporter [Reyranellaceae bacterium]